MFFLFEIKKYDLNLKKILYGYLASQIGNASVRLVFAIIIYNITGSKVTLAASFLVYTLPRLIFSNFLGRFCEKFDPKTIMVSLDFFGFVIFCMLSIFYNELGLFVIFSMFVLADLTTTMFYFSKTRLITKLYPESENINTIVTMVLQISYSSLALGPLCSGYLAQWVSIESALMFNAVTFLISIACIYKVPSVVKNSNVLDAIKDVFLIKAGIGITQNIKVAIKVPILLRISTFHFFRSIAYGILNSVIPVIVLDKLKIGSSGLGDYFFYSILGALLGTILYGKYVKLRMLSSRKMQNLYFLFMSIAEIFFIYLYMSTDNEISFLITTTMAGVFMLLVESRVDYIYADFAPSNAKAAIKSLQGFIKAVAYTLGILITVLTTKYLTYTHLTLFTVLIMLLSFIAFTIRSKKFACKC
jgi:predicted MFS family arabinose efflux permease